MRRWTRTAAGTLLSVVALASGRASAQTLAEYVPQDAAVYAGWAGASTIPGFDKTHMLAVGKLLPVTELFEKRFPEMFARNLPAPKNEQAADLLHTMAKLAWENPSAVYVEGMGRDDNGDEKPSIVLLIDAGADADTVVKDLQQRLDALVEGNAIPNLTFFRTGSVIAVAGNRVSATSPLAGVGPTMDSHPSVQMAVKQGAWGSAKSGGGKPASVLFLNLPRGVQAARTALNENGQLPVKLEALEKPLNFRDLGPLVLLSRPEGAMWVSDAFISTPTQRAGLVGALLDDRPADDALLAALPPNTLTVQSFSVDLSRFLAVAKDVGDVAQPNGSRRVTSALTIAGMIAGASGTAVTDLIEQTGKDWVIATVPSKAGAEGAGNVLTGVGTPLILNRPKDPTKVMTSLTLMARNGVNIANARLGGRVMLELREEKLPEGSLLFIPMPEIPNLPPEMKAQFPPGLAIATSTGVLAMGTDRDAVAAVLAGAAKPAAENLTQSAKFRAVHDLLAAPPGARRDFVDTETLVPVALKSVEAMLALAAQRDNGNERNAAIIEEIKRWIPQADSLRPHLAPAGAASWADAAGYHYRSVTPFPGADVLGNPSGLGVGGGAMVAGVALPSLVKARESAMRLQSAANLKVIGQSVVMYADENGGKLPPDLGTVASKYELQSSAFISPRTGTKPPTGIASNPPELAAWINSKGDYDFVAADVSLSSLDASTVIIAHERNLPGPVAREGHNALFADGHVEFLPAAEFEKRLGASKEAIDTAKAGK